LLLLGHPATAAIEAVVIPQPPEEKEIVHLDPEMNPNRRGRHPG